MIKRALTLLILLVSCSNLFGQSGSLEQLSARYNSAEGIEASFDVAAESFTLKSLGKRFRLTSTSTEILFDGQSLYTFNKQNNELVIEQLEGEQLLLNPTNFFALNLSLFTIEKGVNSTTLTPKQKMEGVESITFTFSQGGNLKGVLVLLEGDKMFEIEFKTLLFKDKVEAKQFEFNKKLYKGAEIIDFR